MNERRKILLISLLIMTCVGLVVGAISFAVLYNAAFERERRRLVETVQSRARLIEAVAEFDAVYSVDDMPGGHEAATLSQVIRAHEQFHGFGKTGEFTLARHEGEQIVFLLRHRHSDLDNPRPVPFTSELAEPMRRALSGQSGTVIGLDYRGEKVLAAYEPVGVLGWGVVCKIDLSEIRRVFVRAGLAAAAVGAVVILAGVLLLLRSTDPLIKRLEGSEAQNRAVLNTAADGIITIDEKGIVNQFNSAAERIFGFTAHEAIGKNINIFIPPPHKERHNDYLARYIRTGEARVIGERMEVEGQRRDGSMFPLEAAVSEVKLPGRRLFTGIFRDITKRKLAYEAHRLDEARLETLVKLSEMAAAPFQQVADSALEQAVKVTRSGMGFLGFLNDDESVLTIHTWSEGAMQECAVADKPRVFQIAESGLWGEAVRQRKAVMVNDYSDTDTGKKGYPEGQMHIARFLGVPIFDGEQIVALAAVANKEDEYQEGDVRQLTLLIGGMWRLIQRRRAEEALRESRSFLQTVIDGIPESLLVIDRDYRVVLANQTAREMAALEDPITGAPGCYEVSHHRDTPCGGTEHPCPLQEVIATKAPVTVMHTHQDADGNEATVELVAAPIFDSSGEVVQIIESCRDITERRRLEKEILEIGRREQQRIGQDLHDAMGQHLTGAAFHAKALQTRLAEQALPEADNAQKIARMINEAITQARALAKGLCPVELTAEGLMSALQEHAANVEMLFGVTCVYRCEEPVLIHDSTVAVHLYRIAQEAVTNAVKHSRARRIELTLAAKNGQPALTIRDDGAGIPDRLDDGKGMGLRIMGYRAKMIRAELSVRRNPEGGTIVECSL